MGFISITSSRLAGVLSVIALIAISISDFTFTEFWDTNAMATSIVADVLVLIVGVAVVNEFITARSRRQWQIVAEYGLVELARSCRKVWIGLAEAIGIGERASLTRDDLRELVSAPEGGDRVEELAERAATEREARAALYEVVSDIAFNARAALTNWAPILVESTHSDSLARFAEMQALLSKLDFILWEESEGKRPSSGDQSDPAWVARRIRTVVLFGAQIELELFAAAEAIEERERRELLAVTSPS